MPLDARIESNETINNTSEIKKKVFAITAALPSINPNPDIPVTSDMIRNINALRTIVLKFYCSGIEISGKKSCRLVIA